MAVQWDAHPKHDALRAIYTPSSSSFGNALGPSGLGLSSFSSTSCEWTCTATMEDVKVEPRHFQYHNLISFWISPYFAGSPITQHTRAGSRLDCAGIFFRFGECHLTWPFALVYFTFLLFKCFIHSLIPPTLHILVVWHPKV